MNRRDQAIVRSFNRALRAANRSERTVASYNESIRYLCRACPDTGLLEHTRQTLTGFFEASHDRLAPATCAHRYRSLRRFFNWAVKEELITVSPMAGGLKPWVPDNPVPVFSDSEIRALLG